MSGSGPRSFTVECDRPLVPRPNPRGGEANDPDERIADLQHRDAVEFSVGHGTSTRSEVVDGVCRIVHTTWMPQCEVERVEPAPIDGVELEMEALAVAADARAVQSSFRTLVDSCRAWIAARRQDLDAGRGEGPRRTEVRLQGG
jgi:hypothetical protein